MGKKRHLGKFILGATIGAGIALLFAPQEGKKTRKELKAKFDELYVKIKNINPKEVQENVTKKITEIREDLKDLDKEKVLTFAKEKAAVIGQKCEDLWHFVKEKSTPVIQKTVDELRVKTKTVLEQAVQKLEKEDVQSSKAKRSKRKEA